MTTAAEKRQILINNLACVIEATNRKDWQIVACEIMDNRQHLGKIYDDLNYDGMFNRAEGNRFWDDLKNQVDNYRKFFGKTLL